MTESRSTRSSKDTITTDLITKLYSHLPDEKPGNMYESEFCIFRFFEILSTRLNGMKAISLIARIILAMQCFSCISLPIMARHVKDIIDANDIGPTFQFLFFIVSFHSYSNDHSTHFIFSYLISIISLSCIFMFCFGMILMYKRKTLTILQQDIFIFFVVELPLISIIPLARAATYFLCNVILRANIRDVLHMVTFVLIFICMLWIIWIESNTYYNSIFYRRGAFSTTSIFSEILIYIAAQVSNVLNDSIDDSDYKLLIFPIFFVILGLIILISNIKLFDLYLLYSKIAATGGFVMFISGAFGIILYFDIMTDTQTIILILACVGIVCYVIIVYICNSKKKKIKLVLDGVEELEELEISDAYFFLQVGFNEAIKWFMDGTFYDWCLSFDDVPPRTQYLVLRYIAILPSKFKYTDDFISMLLANPDKSKGQKYQLYEYFKLQNLKVISDAPKRTYSILTEVEARIGQYEQLRQIFSSKIGINPKITFLVLSALSTMRNILYNYVKSRRITYPNCPDVIKLYSLYLEIVEQSDKAIRWSNIADDVHRGSIQYADYLHAAVLTSHPKVLSYAMNIYENRPRTGVGRLSISRASMVSSQFPIGLDKIEKIVNKNSFFTNRETWEMLISRIVLSLLIISIGIFYIASFGYSERGWRLFSINTNFTELSYNTAVSLASLLRLPVQQINKYGATGVPMETVFNIFNQQSIYSQSWFRFISDAISYCRESKVFNESFKWIHDNIFPIPSYDPTKDVNEELRVMLTRYSILATAIFNQYGEYNGEAAEVPVFLAHIARTNNFLMTAFNLLHTSSQTFATKTRNYIVFNMIYTSIPLYFFGLVVLLLPFIFYQDITKLSSIFIANDNNSEEKQSSLLEAILSRDFKSFPRIYWTNFVMVIIIIGCAIGYLFIVRVNATSCKNTLITSNSNIYNNALHLISTIVALNDLYFQSLINNGTSVVGVTNESLLEEINLCIDIISNRSDQNQANLVTVTRQDFYVVIQFSGMLSSTNIQYSELQADTLSNYIESNYFPDIINVYKSSFEDNIIIFQSAHGKNEIINLVFFLISVICWTVLMREFIGFNHVIRAMMEQLSLLSDSSVSVSDRLTKIISIMGRFTGFKKSCVLDLSNRPCALLDSQNRVISINRQWLAFFDETLDTIIGRSISDLVDDPKFEVTETGDGHKIILLKETKEEEEVQYKLTLSQYKCDLIKSVIIPKRFVALKSGEVKIGFNMCCNVTIMPTPLYEIIPEDWLVDVKNMEHWIEEKCRICDDVEILRTTRREITILFGVNEHPYSPTYLVTMVTMIASDILRWSQEWEWITGKVNIGLVITCGDNATFAFDYAETATHMDMFGPAFEKQMLLRELVDMNSIIICEQTFEILSSLGMMLDFHQLTEESYQFGPLIDEMYYEEVPEEENY